MQVSKVKMRLNLKQAKPPRCCNRLHLMEMWLWSKPVDIFGRHLLSDTTRKPVVDWTARHHAEQSTPCPPYLWQRLHAQCLPNSQQCLAGWRDARGGRGHQKGFGTVDFGRIVRHHLLAWDA
jgi:hypothetical protein